MRLRTPRKSVRAQKSDNARLTLWKRVLGTARDPHDIRLSEWEAFIDARRSGAIDARGRPVRPMDRRPVGDRTIHVDLEMLSSVFNWAKNWKTDRGTYLMRENPIRGYEVPREKNPKRPVATWDRYEAIRATSDADMMEVRAGAKVHSGRSHLSELLDLAVATGRRISAICALTYADLRLSRTHMAPTARSAGPRPQTRPGRRLQSLSTRLAEARLIASSRSAPRSGTRPSSLPRRIRARRSHAILRTSGSVRLKGWLGWSPRWAAYGTRTDGCGLQYERTSPRRTSHSLEVGPPFAWSKRSTHRQMNTLPWVSFCTRLG